MGGANRWWVYKSLQSLNQIINSALVFREGMAQDVISKLIKDTGARAIFWNRCYEPWRIARDKTIKTALESSGIKTQSFNASLLWEPWDIKKNDGTPYKVFTPFYRKGCLNAPPPRKPLPAPQNIDYRHIEDKGRIDTINLLPTHPWHKKLENHWTPSEDGAQKTLHRFLEHGLCGYKIDRNRPDLSNVSYLSPFLHAGNISPHQIWHAAQEVGLTGGLEKDTDHFCSELGWREFSYSLLYHFPDLPRKNLQSRFDVFPWEEDEAFLHAWQRGRTGIPIVDAGMRELWETGWMHNRVRMIVGSLLVKNLLLHWHHGEEWFWDCLVDADLANNAASWQWIAGCGADAAPYFRVFNPVTQADKFDPLNIYIKKWVPEIGTPDYPAPIVDLKESRLRALAAFEQSKKPA